MVPPAAVARNTYLGYSLLSRSDPGNIHVWVKVRKCHPKRADFQGCNDADRVRRIIVDEHDSRGWLCGKRGDVTGLGR